ncbi:hypothetical protein GALMADRAFT_151450 [Galerina marginata CBS 339.88]|uniref:Major facilitator superfamily (MFS) profile domain-containing protein n=1 Tax=Galerina marginata (strain CBS 339.88) TaxID=685588 RepID=A0A067TN59_GALM3|nr:hypothetical protein GALMADRAFT_151450 [Galerina marginata CBS 339.88]
MAENSSRDSKTEVTDMEKEMQSEVKPVDPPKPTFPEGGFRAWATVLGAFFIQMCGFGYTTSFGVFQDYYVRVHLSNESASTISWIGSVNAFVVIAAGLIVGRIYDKGYFYALLWGGSILISFSLFMLSLTKPGHFYQVFLSQGLGVGIGIGMIYLPSIAVLSHYFQRRRAFVMTAVATGSAVGSVVHPIMLNNTLDSIGFAKGTRASAGLVSGLLLISCLLMRTRLPPPQMKSDLKTSLIKFSKDKAYLCCTAAFFFFIIALYFPIFYLQLDATKHNLSPNFAFYSLVILNGTQLFGRIAATFLTGKVGIPYLAIGASACCSIIIFGMIGVSSVASVVIIAVLYGFASGIYVAIMAPMVAGLADDFSEIGMRMGISFTMAGVGGLVGTPIDGALLTSEFHWWKPAVFSGVMGMVGCSLYIGMAYFMRQKAAMRAAAAAQSKA